LNDLIPTAIVIAIEPLPIVGFILVVSTERGVRNGAAYIAAWLGTIIAILLGTVLLTGGEPLKTESVPGQAMLIGYVVIGIACLGLALRRSRAEVPDPPPQPSWMSRLDGMTMSGAAALGFLLQPWTLVALGVSTVLTSGTSGTTQVIELVLFVVISTSTLAAMEIYTVVSPATAGSKLAALRTWVDRNRNRSIIILLIIIGCYLIAKGVYGLVA